MTKGEIYQVKGKGVGTEFLKEVQELQSEIYISTVEKINRYHVGHTLGTVPSKTVKDFFPVILRLRDLRVVRKLLKRKRTGKFQNNNDKIPLNLKVRM